VIKRGPQGETVYVNQWFTVRNRQVVSKHVYAGSTRIATNMVMGVKAVAPTDLTVGPAPVTGSAPPVTGTNPVSSSKLPLAAQQAPGILKGQGLIKRSPQAAENARNVEKNPHYADVAPADGPVTEPVTGPVTGPVAGPAAGSQDNFLYYYHPDHLGSSSYVTDAIGKLYQHLEYFPFGEAWVEENSNTQRTPYLFTAKELDEETGLSYFGARYYDPRTSVWQSPDPILEGYLEGRPGGGVFNPKNLGMYTYGYSHPLVFKDPDGNSPISVLAMKVVKKGAVEGLQNYAEKNIQRRLGKYMSEQQMKQFKKDVDKIMETFDSEWWEVGLEFVPVIGDVYGTGKFAMNLRKAHGKMQDLENKWVGKIADKLPPEKSEKFKQAMRNAGVRDARKDVNKKNEVLGTKDPHVGLEGHHRTSVLEDPSKASDPRNIEFMSKKRHLDAHEGDWRNKTAVPNDIDRN
jgi:RHS repeat-associated protein